MLFLHVLLIILVIFFFTYKTFKLCFLFQKQILFFFFLNNWSLPSFNIIWLLWSPDQCLKRLETVYHWALRFITSSGNLVHYCNLYCALANTVFFLKYKSLLGLVPSHLCSYMCTNQNQHGLRSHNILYWCFVLWVKRGKGKNSFKPLPFFSGMINKMTRNCWVELPRKNLGQFQKSMRIVSL